MASAAAVLAGAGRRGVGLVLLPVTRRAGGVPGARFGRIYTLLENKYYMDWINENVIARRRAASAAACGRAATRP